MKKLLITAALLVTSACQSEIMAEYVGRDVRELKLYYGGPATQEMDMGDGVRAFQWRRVLSHTSDEVVEHKTTYETDKSGKRISGSERTKVTVKPSETRITNCLDTYFAEKINGRWIVTSFQQPSFACE